MTRRLRERDVDTFVTFGRLRMNCLHLIPHLDMALALVNHQVLPGLKVVLKALKDPDHNSLIHNHIADHNIINTHITAITTILTLMIMEDALAAFLDKTT